MLISSHLKVYWLFKRVYKMRRRVSERVQWQSPTAHPNERPHADFSSYPCSWFLIKVLNLEGRYVGVFKVIDIPSVAQPPPSQPPDITLNASISTISGPHTFFPTLHPISISHRESCKGIQLIFWHKSEGANLPVRSCSILTSHWLMLQFFFYIFTRAISLLSLFSKLTSI